MLDWKIISYRRIETKWSRKEECTVSRFDKSRLISPMNIEI